MRHVRKLHDSVTQEFVNIGVAVYSPDARFLRARCATHYARITRMFAKSDADAFAEQLEKEVRKHEKAG